MEETQKRSSTGFFSADCREETIPVAIHREDESTDGVITWVSSRSLRLESETPFRFAEHVKIEIPDDDVEYSSRSLLAQVEIVQPLSDSTWLVGCSYDATSAHQFFDLLARNKNIDRRTLDRTTFAGKGNVQFEGSQTNSDIQIENMNEHGCCFLVDENADVGSRMILKVDFHDTNTKEVRPTEIRATKVWQKNLGKGIMLGCQFMQPLCLSNVSMGQPAGVQGIDRNLTLLGRCLELIGLQSNKK